jgi:hypothetical protein
MILIGFVLVVSGVVFPFMMVANYIEKSYWLSFLSYGASLVGLFLGVIGSAYYVREKRKK